MARPRKYTTRQWSQIQKEAWARRKARTNTDDTKAIARQFEKSSGLMKTAQLATSLSDRVAALETALNTQSKDIALAFDRLQRLEIEDTSRTLYGIPPAPQVPKDGKYKLLIDTANVILEKIYQGNPIGMLDYDALKRGIDAAES